jgi:cytochrome P450
MKPIEPGSFIPFGEGPRNCIGFKVALLEIKIILLRIIEKFDLSLGTDQSFDTISFLTRKWRDPVTIELCERN